MCYDDFNCPICDRVTPKEYQENHHLVPKQLKGRRKTVVCCDCHDMIHETFTNRELAKKFNRIDIIKQDVRMIKWAQWVAKKDFRFKITMAKKKRRK